MSTNKYTIYRCDVCQRQTEIMLDAKRPDPVRCNITLRCRGKLQHVGIRATKSSLFTPIVPGLQDYIPRGASQTVVPQEKPTSPVSLFTSGRPGGMLTIAAIRSIVRGNTAIYYVQDEGNRSYELERAPSTSPDMKASSIVISVFELTPELLRFKKYTYRAGVGTQLIRGLDNSDLGINLRFNGSDRVKVFLNGIELPEARYDRSLPDQITLTPMNTDADSTIDVIVYNDLIRAIDQKNLINLIFNPLTKLEDQDFSARSESCWGDQSAVRIDGVERHLLYCTDLSALDPDKSYAVLKVEAYSDISKLYRNVNNSEVFILLGREPFGFKDKELNAYVSGANLVKDGTVITYHPSEATGNSELVINETLVTQIFNSIDPTRPVAVKLTNNADQGTTVHPAEGIKRKYILGPS